MTCCPPAAQRSEKIQGVLDAQAAGDGKVCHEMVQAEKILLCADAYVGHEFQTIAYRAQIARKDIITGSSAAIRHPESGAMLC